MMYPNVSGAENAPHAPHMGSGHVKAAATRDDAMSTQDPADVTSRGKDVPDVLVEKTVMSPQLTPPHIVTSPNRERLGAGSVFIAIPDEVTSAVPTPCCVMALSDDASMTSRVAVWSPEVMEAEPDYDDVMDVVSSSPDVTGVSAMPMTRQGVTSPNAMDFVVRDVEFMRWEDEDEEEFPLKWSTAAEDKSMRRRFLCDVCRAKDSASLQRMVTSGWDVNETLRQTRETFTSFGSIVLHDNFRALHQAARESWLDGVRILLEGGADIDSFDFRDARDQGFSYTALMHAANNSDEFMMRHLVEVGANVNARDPLTRNSALLLAAVSCSVRCVEYLIEVGADVNVVGINNEMIPSTPLLAAVYYYRLPQWHHLSHEWRSSGGRERSRVQALTLMRMLIASGCDVNESGSDLPPLHNSASCRDQRALELLLNAGACVNVVTRLEDRQSRTTALAEAAIANSITGVRLLIQHGAHLDIDRVCLDSLGHPEPPMLMRLLNRRHYDIAAMLVYAGWHVSMEEQSKMAAVCALIPSGPIDDTADSDDTDEEDSAAVMLDSELLNMSERSRTRRLKLEALRWALNFLTTPHGLRWHCRAAIRASMINQAQRYVRTLPLPVPLLSYVMFNDL